MRTERQSRYLNKKAPGQPTDMAGTYTEYYRNRQNKDHSPEASRTSIVRRMRQHIPDLSQQDWVLDIGSGKESIFDRYVKTYGRPEPSFVSFDLAKIKAKDLLATRKGWAAHVEGNANSLPFASSDTSLHPFYRTEHHTQIARPQIGLVISNMALDFIDEIGLDEIRRVLKPEGKIIANLCFSYLNPPDNPQNFWHNYLRTNSVLFSDPSQIEPTFNKHGFTIDNIERAGKFEKWWEIDAHKNRK